MEYKGYLIQVTADLEFSAEGIGKFKTGDAIKSAIDTLIKVKYEQIKVIVFNMNSTSTQLEEYIATRPHDIDPKRDRCSVWVVKGKGRGTVRDAYEDTPENRAIFEQAISHRTIARDHSKQADGLIKTMTRPVFKEI